MRSALVHDWLVGVGGGEKVLQAIHQLFPSPIYSLVHHPKALENTYFQSLSITTSFLQNLPNFRNFLPLFPFAIERFDLSSYDLILSSSHCVAKGILKAPHQTHICYCHTPMRYAWDLQEEYVNSLKGLKRPLARIFLKQLRKWDAKTAPRVDHFIANSHYVAQRIERCYGRKSDVIYPPIDLSFFSPSDTKEDYFLTASRLVPYKRIDLIVEAFSRMPDKKLIVIGDGPEMGKIKAKASRNVEILGYQTDAILREYLQKAKAFVFAALEDFGILPVEAMACGTPVIAFGRGGAAETVIKGQTGWFFGEQSAESIQQAILDFEKRNFDPAVCRQRAERFSQERFQGAFRRCVKRLYICPEN